MRKIRRWGPGLLLVSLSIVLIAVFVYGLIGWNVKVSLSDWRQSQETTGFDTGAYSDLFPSSGGEIDDFVKGVATGDQSTTLSTDPGWIIDLHHALLFTVVFVGGALLMGAFLAFLLDKGVKGEGVFRAIYLFPMAVSFIAAGVVWRWLMNPAPGDRSTGFNLLFEKLGLGFLGNEWYLGQTWGAGALAIPAVWALSGYIMALFLAGFRGCPRSFARRHDDARAGTAGCCSGAGGLGTGSGRLWSDGSSTAVDWKRRGADAACRSRGSRRTRSRRRSPDPAPVRPAVVDEAGRVPDHVALRGWERARNNR